MSRRTLPPIVPQAIGYKLREIRLMVLETVASPYMKAVPTNKPTRTFAAKPDFRLTNAEYSSSRIESISRIPKLSGFIKAARPKPKAKRRIEAATACFKDNEPAGIGRFGLITASLSLSK